jgi:hypothetical protein
MLTVGKALISALFAGFVVISLVNPAQVAPPVGEVHLR